MPQAQIVVIGRREYQGCAYAVIAVQGGNTYAIQADSSRAVHPGVDCRGSFELGVAAQRFSNLLGRWVRIRLEGQGMNKDLRIDLPDLQFGCPTQLSGQIAGQYTIFLQGFSAGINMADHPLIRRALR